MRINRGSFSVVERMVAAVGMRRARLFILAALKQDDSLTSILLGAGGSGPGHVEGLVVPSGHLAHPDARKAVEFWGSAAVRLWLLVLADPGVIYSTNPSTLAVFLGTLRDRWDEAAALARDHARDPAAFDPGLRRIARKVAAPGWWQRLRRVARAERAPDMGQLAPSLSVYSCWDGGYVRSFLAAIEGSLPAPRYRLVPMYSMSTETVETLTVFDGAEVRFCPLAPGVLYEFLPADAPDDPSALLAPWELEPGRAYLLVVSDAYGLTRYQTEDIFGCEAMLGDCPDLRFLRRRGLAYSFTGEKLTGEQMGEAFGRLRDEPPGLPREVIALTCVPTQRGAGGLPGYVLALATSGGGGGALVDIDAAAVAARFDAVLGEVNTEYASKRQTKRLAAPRAVCLSYDRLAAALDAKTDAARTAWRSWESQFKLLPLYRRLWEEQGLDGA
jgi:hypothetical protein